MKKIHITASILMVLIFMGNSGAFVEKRHQWWEVRLRELEAEKAKLQKTAVLDRQVLGIIEHEMDRARDIIAVFESEMRNDGSLTHETRTMTGEDLAAEARTTVPPLYALHLLGALVHEGGTGPAAAAAREEVEKRLSAMIRNYFGEESPGLVNRIMEKDITGYEWKTMAMEYSIGTMMASKKARLDHAIADVAGRMSLALKEKEYRANGRELRLLAIKVTGEYLAECSARDLPHDSAALEASWTWRRIEANLARDFSSCKKIIALVRDPALTRGAASLERIMYYHRNPADMESLLFRGQRPQPGAAGSAAQNGKRWPAGAVIMDIPAPVNAAAVMDDIDRIRRGAVGAITGREDEQYFTGLEKSMAAAVSRHSAAVKNRLFREEERVRLLRMKGGGNLQVANEKEFLEARRQFTDTIALIDNYVKKSMACVAVVSEGRTISSGAIVDWYRYRLQRSEEYLRFAAAIVNECSRLSFVEDPRVHKQYADSMSRVGPFLNSIVTVRALERGDQTHLTKRDMGTIRELKAVFNATAGSIRADISSSHGTYLAKRSATDGIARKGREHLKETIAQDEIDGLFRHAVECVELFEQYRYGEKSLFQYADLYRAFLKQARTGNPSEGLWLSLKMNSLLVSLDHFDGGRVARELATKQYLQKEAKTSLARLATMLEFYKKNNVTFKDAPQPAEIASLEKRISAAPMVKIDSWVMNESNYREIDKNAARKLSLILNRRELSSVSSKAGEGKNQSQPLPVISLNEPELSLTLPRGWEEDTVGEADTYQGIVKSFHSGDGNSSVRLVKLALDSGDMKDAAEGWMEKSGCKLVEKRWQKAGDVDCLWILSRDRNKNIFETCAISRDGYAVLISGKTSRNSYAVFRIQFRKIINSLQMETL
ncbi:MAG TPA: hypothetical protein PLM53_12240 [Spirochaetota bacterium]|nr:hypothetical protein [Spirochaetota bacterium]HPC39886.1 hypothetical protein [Spirochaetota bacterium]HPL18046.1 hypothetical protein [Spirochaetota bacterium]HQF08938.1 hypothetical protein [Spirochaetota bacterium]HQH97864.1 hypothetical protein [Spirochaetota bacterium]